MRRLRDPFVTRITLPLLLAAVVLGGGQLWGESIPIRLIPYYAWSNRGPSEMTVWMPLM